MSPRGTADPDRGRAPEEDWRRFNRGERGIFVRKILGFREKNRLAAISEKYREDGEFRDYVTRYMGQFENLLQESKKRDHEGVLATTFLSSLAHHPAVRFGMSP